MLIRELSKQFDLWGSEAQVFEYIATLYYHGCTWKGTLEKLGFESRCGSKQTTARAVSKLVQLNLLAHNKNEIGISNQEIKDQIGTDKVHSGTTRFQNGINEFQNGTDYEKESNQRKRVKEKIESESEGIIKEKSTSRPPSRQDFFDYINSINMPPEAALRCLSFYEMRDWRNVYNWKAAVSYWLSGDKQRQ